MFSTYLFPALSSFTSPISYSWDSVFVSIANRQHGWCLQLFSEQEPPSLSKFRLRSISTAHRPVTWCLDFMSDKPGMYNPCASRSPCDPFPQTSAVTIAVHQAHTRTHKTRINCSCSCWVLSPSLYFAPGDREISKTPCLLPFLPSASVARSG